MVVQQPERTAPVEDDNSTRQRILAATAEVLGRSGGTKLSLSEVALQARVSRPTLYRWFDSKEDLLDAFVVWERQSYERAVADVEPAHVIKRLSQILPLMRERLERLALGPDGDLAAATAVRVAISHYLVRSDDADEFLAQLRHAARIKPDRP